MAFELGVLLPCGGEEEDADREAGNGLERGVDVHGSARNLWKEGANFPNILPSFGIQRKTVGVGLEKGEGPNWVISPRIPFETATKRF